MKIVLQGLTLAAVVVALTGCNSMTGHWTMESIKPESAGKDFQLHMMCLKADNTYCAEAGKAGQAKCMAGTYKYDAGAKQLTFMSDGKDKVYNAEMTDATTMKVWGGEKGKEWTAVMKKGDKCPADCCPAKCAKTCPAHKEEAKKEEPKKAEVKKEAKKEVKAEVKKEEPKKADKPKDK